MFTHSADQMTVRDLKIVVLCSVKHHFVYNSSSFFLGAMHFPTSQAYYHLTFEPIKACTYAGL